MSVVHFGHRPYHLFGRIDAIIAPWTSLCSSKCRGHVTYERALLTALAPAFFNVPVSLSEAGQHCPLPPSLALVCTSSRPTLHSNIFYASTEAHAHSSAITWLVHSHYVPGLCTWTRALGLGRDERRQIKLPGIIDLGVDQHDANSSSTWTCC